MKIAALVSGGVDSSVMVPILKEQGFDSKVMNKGLGEAVIVIGEK